MLLVIAILLVLVLIGIARCIVIVPQSNAYVTEWLGVYKDTWGAGLHLRTPFVERVSRKVSLKEEAADFPPQPVITRDNVTMMIDTVVFFQVFDAKLFAYGVNRPIQAIENLSATTLRDIIGSMSLDETLTSRDLINTKITASLDEATDRWGIKVNRVELKNIEPPAEIRQAMEKQMKADREKRASILLAEGEKQAAITRAEGEKAEAKEPVCHVQERVYGSFCRQIGLAEDADVENISASHKNGVLTIVIPRKQPEAPAARSITVQKQ